MNTRLESSLRTSNVSDVAGGIGSYAPAELRERVPSRDIERTPDDFTVVALRIREAGLLDRRTGYYTAKIVLTLATFAAAWTALVIVGDSWKALGVAALLGVIFTQLSFVAHDAGHQQILKSRRANSLLWFTIADGMIGLSFGWWVAKHNAHHAHPNQVGRDPDIAEGFVANSTDGTGRVQHGLARLLARRQAGLFFPLMLLRSTGLHVLGIQRLLRRRDRGAALEGLLIVAHAGLYLAAVLWVLSPMKALAFIVVQQAVFSVYLGCSFAPNHKGMPLIDAHSEMAFARRQVITARNVAGGKLTTFMLGGLNYQIEHHLFPTMPRRSLPRAQSIVRAFCLENNLGYAEDSLVGSFRQAIRHLRTASIAAERPSKGSYKERLQTAI